MPWNISGYCITFRYVTQNDIVASLYVHTYVFSLCGFQVTVDLGKDAEFQCSVTGQPHPVISWAKDGLPVREGSSGRTKITGNDGSMLRISSIVRDDKGMYQCFAKNDYEMVQATAELRLGGTLVRFHIALSCYECNLSLPAKCFAELQVLSEQFVSTVELYISYSAMN